MKSSGQTRQGTKDSSKKVEKSREVAESPTFTRQMSHIIQGAGDATPKPAKTEMPAMYNISICHISYTQGVYYLHSRNNENLQGSVFMIGFKNFGYIYLKGHDQVTIFMFSPHIF